MADDYCDLCDLPKSTCVHGLPPAPPTTPASTPVRSPRVSTRTPRAPKAAAPAAPTRRAPRKWTPPEDFAPHIIAVLEDAGGELDIKDVLNALESRVADNLLEGDRQLTPEGELRWQLAARRARQSMIQDGVMRRGAPGVWSLS